MPLRRPLWVPRPADTVMTAAGRCASRLPAMPRRPIPLPLAVPKASHAGLVAGVGPFLKTSAMPVALRRHRGSNELCRQPDEMIIAAEHASLNRTLMSESAGTLTPSNARVAVDGRSFCRAGRKLRINGCSYGPFAANGAGEQFPDRGRVIEDFVAMRAIGINALRVYHLPPEWFLDLADEEGMMLLIGLSWSWHLCFLDRPEIQTEARDAMRAGAERCRRHSCVLGYVLANEISPDIMRWHGGRRVARFLSSLGDTVKQTDPDGLVTYANFPPTEYLDVGFADFATFNVYLHEAAAFRKYLFHLQNLTGDRPLILGELGMDTLRHGEDAQARFLAGHLREAALMGLAGSFVFAWTDDWHTGGYAIEDWAFGVTTRDRRPKLSYEAVGEVFRQSPEALLATAPRVSVVVCSYNGGRTLDQCLRSLLELDYPDYEVILVDDGSTDDTRAIASRFPTVRAIHQENQGLSEARNVGLRSATGEIIAYTDSDCFVDPHWLTHLVHQLQSCDAAAVGGPNLTPEDGWLAACVAASPGQPTHVLENDHIAEHIPGCNMACRREALEAVHGFNPRYRTAGDDVDLCWRLQQANRWITFAPGAFVWHHRRQSPRAYLRQQAGYGEAEGLLWFDHPNHFNVRGESMWRGRMYGAAAESLPWGRPVVYHGIWGTGLFQTLYQPSVAAWAGLPGTLEWHVLMVLAGTVALHWPAWWIGVAVMLSLSLLLAVLRSMHAPLAPRHHGWSARVLIAGLCYVQPLVRSWSRYRARLFPAHALKDIPDKKGRGERLVCGLLWLRTLQASYWNEPRSERTELLRAVATRFAVRQWPLRMDPGWEDWDLEIFCGPWTVLHLHSAQEDHGRGGRSLRLRCKLHRSAYARVITGAALLAVAVAASLHTAAALGIAGAALLLQVLTWWHGSALASRAMDLVDAEMSALGLSCIVARKEESASGAPADR